MPLWEGASRGSHRHIASAPSTVGTSSSSSADRQPICSAIKAVPTRPTNPPNTNDPV